MVAEDDWVRWGSATQTHASNMKGHEFRCAYGIMKDMNVVARLYLVEVVSDDNNEDGNRLRVDLNYTF